MIGFLQTLIQLVLTIYDWFIFWEILLDFQRGVILRLGKYHRMAEPGWNWRLPFGLEELLFTHIVPTTADLPPQAVVTTDGVQVLLEVVILWSVPYPKKFLLEVENAVSVLAEAAQGTIYEVAGDYDWEDLQKVGLNDDLTSSIRNRAKKWGVKVISVQVTSMSRLGLRYGCFRIAQPAALHGT